MQVGEGARHELLERIPAPARVVEPHKDGPVAPVRAQEVKARVVAQLWPRGETSDIHQP